MPPLPTAQPLRSTHEGPFRNWQRWYMVRAEAPERLWFTDAVVRVGNITVTEIDELRAFGSSTEITYEIIGLTPDASLAGWGQLIADLPEQCRRFRSPPAPASFP